jgi:hypothetical protein
MFDQDRAAERGLEIRFRHPRGTPRIFKTAPPEKKNRVESRMNSAAPSPIFAPTQTTQRSQK